MSDTLPSTASSVDSTPPSSVDESPNKEDNQGTNGKPASYVEQDTVRRESKVELPQGDISNSDIDSSKPKQSETDVATVLENLIGTDVETSIDVGEELEAAVRDYSWKRSLEERKADSQKRNLQAASYFIYLEDMIRNLDKRLVTVEKAPKASKVDGAGEASEGNVEDDKASEEEAAGSEASEEEDESEVKPKPLVRGAAYMSWREFMEPITEVREAPLNVTEVCLEPPHSLVNPGLLAGQSSASTIPSHYDSENFDKDKIERIRIRSWGVNDALKSVLGLEDKMDSSKVHIRPFKALHRARDGLRAHYDTLTSKRSTSEQDAESDDERDCREELSGFLDFMDTAFRPLAMRHDQLASSNDIQEGAKVRFSELWHLFEPGRVIYDPRELQAYIVTSVRGGRHFLRTKADDPAYDTSIQSAVDGPINSFYISAVCLNYNGKEVGPVQRDDFIIAAYDGSKLITNLAVFPIEYYDSLSSKGAESPSTGSTEPLQVPGAQKRESLKEKLQKRGEKFIAMAATEGKPSHLDYNGFTLEKVREQVDSQIIVDFDFYYKTRIEEIPELGVREQTKADPREIQDTFGLDCGCSDPNCSIKRYTVFNDECVDDAAVKKFKDKHMSLFRWSVNQEKLKTDYAFLLPRRINAFVLRSRTWCALDIGNTSPVLQKKDSFNHLVLPDQHKKIVEAVVRRHSVGAKPIAGIQGEDDSKYTDDLVRGKGKGIIILLHGVPGVGKTSTAETVADLTGRPLFALTCGDIGDNALDVQNNLEENFKLAHRWGCVMLLDEADVFLQQRTRNDMKTNAIVSVFLRVLEYYSGILFLTTNKVGTFDEAFKSRIHVALYYRPLDREQSLQIWENNLTRIQNARPHMQMDIKKLKQWAENEWKKNVKKADDSNKPHRPWNGRQIHNACQTAAALAEFEAYDNDGNLKKTLKLTTKNLIAVSHATKEFDRYLLATHGFDDTGRAHAAKDRGDDQYNSAVEIPPKKSKKKKTRVVESESEEEEQSESDDE